MFKIYKILLLVPFLYSLTIFQAYSDDSGSIVGYNIILDDKYTVGDYKKNFIKLCKDIKCKKNV